MDLRIQLLVFNLLLLLLALLCSMNSTGARITSTYIRPEWPSVDIPLDNEAFTVPKGHNAPQQVSNGVLKHSRPQ